MTTPFVNISIPPEDLYAATNASLTLTCNVDFDPSLARFTNVSVTWLKESFPLSNAVHRVSISSILMDSQFTSNLTLYPLSSEDSANFTCRAGIIPSDNLTLLTASDLTEETVQVVVQGELLVN